MSICSLWGLQSRLCRQAFRLAAMRHKQTQLPTIAWLRGSHNSLYQMSDTSKECRNTEVLKAKDCFVKNPTAPKDCPKPPPPPPPPPKKPCDEGNKDDWNRRLFYALLAALGVGGLLYLLFWRNTDKDKGKDRTGADGQGKGDGSGSGSGENDGSGGIAGIAGFAGGAAAGGRISSNTIPASSADLPNRVPYLLIGGGTAAFSAFRAIKSNDPRAKVLMITDEMRKPYMRPPLSKELWYSAQQGEISKDYRFKQWTGAERSLYFEPEEFFADPKKLLSLANGGIAVAQGFRVRKVDPEKRVVTLNDGYQISYDDCLIATGCSPKNLPILDGAPPGVKDKIMLYRTPEDFENLKRYADQKKTIAIIGNGFTGSELACSLAHYSKGLRIYQIFPEKGNMAKVLPGYLSKWTTKKLESEGVCVLNNVTLKNAVRENDHLKLTLSNGKTLLADVAVVCIGCAPNTQLASASGLEVNHSLGGFVVNAELEARRNLFVAGDASCFFDPLLGRRRVEHHDHSVVSGRLAGENMVGKNKAYNHQSMFWSDLGPNIGYEGIGLVDASLPTVGVFALPSKNTKRSTENLSENVSETTSVVKTGANLPPVPTEEYDADQYGRGVIFYLKDDKVVGILLWNLFNRIGLARTIINQNKSYSDLNEVAKLFEIHS